MDPGLEERELHGRVRAARPARVGGVRGVGGRRPERQHEQVGGHEQGRDGGDEPAAWRPGAPQQPRDRERGERGERERSDRNEAPGDAR